MKRRLGGIVMAYDASCGPCSKFKAMVGFLDARRHIHFLDIEDADRAGLLDGVPQTQRYASFHIVGAPGNMARADDVISGPAAILPLVEALSSPAGMVVGRLSPLEAALRFGYSSISRLHKGCPPSHVQAKRRGLRDGG